MHDTLASWARRVATPDRWELLPADDRRQLGEDLRDAFFAPERDDDDLLRALVDRIDPPPIPPLAIEGLEVSFCPTRRHKAVRFVDASLVDPSVRPLFVRPGAPNLAAGFVDPEELSYRTYENIVPLDRVLSRTKLEISLRARTKLAAVRDVFSFAIHADAPTESALLLLDSLDLYVSPMNGTSRGGRRFIFHAAKLAEALGRAVKEKMPESLLEGFSHVNPVFRCNRFEPGDAPFRSHHDTPYYDASRKHVSRYTVLLYLTGGSSDAAPALRIEDDVALRTIAPMTCVIFDQRHEHEGAPYDTGGKVFLRTELVYAVKDLAHEPRIAADFAKACYLTGESVFAPELARWAHEYYERAAQARWRGWREAPGSPPSPFFHKRFRGVDFVSNGHDYWFPRRAVSLEECAVLALLDHFKCRIAKKPFRRLCETKVVEGPEDGASWVPAFLAPYDAPRDEPLFAPLDKEALLPPLEELDAALCCAVHAPRGAAVREESVRERYERDLWWARHSLVPAPIVFLGQEVFLDTRRFVVEPGKIHVLTKEQIAPVNFAGCWNRRPYPEDYVGVEATFAVLHDLVPPILWDETSGCRHLVLDFFRNDWMLGAHVGDDVELPKVLEEPQNAD